MDFLWGARVGSAILRPAAWTGAACDPVFGNGADAPRWKVRVGYSSPAHREAVTAIWVLLPLWILLAPCLATE